MAASQTTSRLLPVAARLGYVAVVLIATITPLRFDFAQAAARLGQAFDIGYSPKTLVDAAQNLALFAGWGALWIVTAPPLRGLRPLLWPTTTGFALSLSVETFQLFLVTRTPSVLDVFTNTTGSLLGAGFVTALVWAAAGQRDRRSYFGVPAFLFAGSLVAAALFLAVLGEAGERLGQVGPLDRLGRAFERFELASFGSLPYSELVLFLPAGLFGLVALAEAGMPHRAAVRYLALGGLAVGLVTELMRGALGLPIEAGAVVMRTVGVTLGALLAARWLPPFSRTVRGRWRPIALATLYAVGIAVWAWRPFRFETEPAWLELQLSASRLVPLEGGSWRLGLSGVGEVGESFFLFLPLGALLAVWPVKREGWLRGWLPGWYLALVTELGQIAVVDRYFDVTDLLVEAAAVAIGWAIVHRAGYPIHGAMLPRAEARRGPVAGRATGSG